MSQPPSLCSSAEELALPCSPALHSFYDEPAYDDEPLDDAYDGEVDANGLMNGEGAVDESGQPNGVVHSSAGGDPATAVAGQPNQERVTTPYMTKYERARILGTRALQIR